jgi:hypothetical protein
MPLTITMDVHCRFIIGMYATGRDAEGWNS